MMSAFEKLEKARATRETKSASARDRVEIADFLGVSPKTIERRLQTGAWEKAEQYKVDMLLHLKKEAADVFGDPAQSALWLTTPTPALDNQAPIMLLDTIGGYERARNALLRQAYGMF
ncbi:antitoxin Xre/MbcA/ParS toxin-binding domain-containing protein [Deinococcus sp. SM5_A1]|uniref:antitoxin Xre/MbcA/ParS toxin-binding domain-containing protein n=1 Tax=Deinococcus sp. SM5_A1 TaxID=3379094 RepID=UPI00385935F5